MSAARPASGLAENFALILDGICAAMAARMARPQTLRERLAAPLLMLLWSRLRHLIARFASLAARAAAGPLPTPTPRRRATRSRAQAGPRRAVPRGFGWLIRLVPETAAFASQLQHLLTRPEMAALVTAAPQTGRLLRPLCRMLAIPPPPAPAKPQPPLASVQPADPAPDHPAPVRDAAVASADPARDQA